MHVHTVLQPRHIYCHRPSRPQFWALPCVGQQLLCVNKAYSSNPYPSAQQQPQGSQDFLGGVLDLCLTTCSRITNAAVGRLTDAVAMVAPPGAERHKVEVAVKGALFLSALGLLKGVINAVLLVGCVALVLYTVTQVFGMNAIVLGRDRQPGSGTWQQPGPQQQRRQQQQQQQQPFHQQQHYSPPGEDSSRQQQQPPSQQWQQQHWQQHRAWPPAGSEGVAQEDVVDVFRGPPAA